MDAAIKDRAVDRVRVMADHRVANPALNDPEALARIGDEAGYWYFKGVLDKQSVIDAKTKMVEALIAAGYVDEGATEPEWNGKDLAQFSADIKDHLSKDVWRRLVEHPLNRAFFEKMIGGQAFWLPMDFYRLRVPYTKAEPPADLTRERHQDGYGSDGLPFVTCWIPLMEIDSEVGGLTLAEGIHKHGMLHTGNSIPRIPIGVIPEESWRHSDYEPGDVVIFKQNAPHSGLDNYSRKFRLSVDLRVMSSANKMPVLGRIEEIDLVSVRIRTDQDEIVTLRFGEDSYCCVRGDVPLTREETVRELGPGRDVLALEHDGEILILRPQTHYENAG